MWNLLNFEINAVFGKTWGICWGTNFSQNCLLNFLQLVENFVIFAILKNSIPTKYFPKKSAPPQYNFVYLSIVLPRKTSIHICNRNAKYPSFLEKWIYGSLCWFISCLIFCKRNTCDFLLELRSKLWRSGTKQLVVS